MGDGFRFFNDLSITSFNCKTQINFVVYVTYLDTYPNNIYKMVKCKYYKSYL